MDLRPYVKTPKQLKRAKDLIGRGLLVYQPYIFADDLQTGAGYEFLCGEYSGMVYWPGVNGQMRNRRLLVDPACKEQFVDANQRLRRMYDGFVEQICRQLGDIRSWSVADIGCNSGYFPVSFALRGVKRAVGFDRGNFAGCFALLNQLLGTKAQFVKRHYQGWRQRIPRCGRFDLVLSMVVLCHLSDPLQHLAFLGSIARRALFVWTTVSDDDDLSIRFGQPNKYYHKDAFPYCFDNAVRLSVPLLRRSLELMGFTEIHEFANTENAMPDHFYDAHRAILAIR